MPGDRVLIWKVNRGNHDALRRIYHRYKQPLYALAVALLRNTHLAEDVVQDVFARFAQQAGNFRLTGSLKGYLSTCVANRARNLIRDRQTRGQVPLPGDDTHSDEPTPWETLVHDEESHRIQRALQRLPYEQAEAVILHAPYGVTFREIARSQRVPDNTVQSRYRYGMEQLRGLLNDTVESHCIGDRP